jgi:hypothetical protein
MSPPFLNLFPLADEITTGLIDLLGVMFGVCAGQLAGRGSKQGCAGRGANEIAAFHEEAA